ncbi:MobF family relaxase [Pseudactinotalea terrae]|uniref:MobF family relaxase n=1 Tax=Pseudactinotalea terrae TaxID=1743262 RepID=UPI0012E2190F|nr:MobF family relaxase [Pseudactinotalea terrae]
MTIHSLHAGNGYEYLTRQVASGDEVRRGQSLSDYYNAHGNPPGRWVGSGTRAMEISGQVDALQMRSLFAFGAHPNDEARVLGRPFLRRRELEDDPYLIALEQAFTAFASAHDRAPQAGVERERIRWQVATQMVRQSLGGEPSKSEVARYLAQRSPATREGVSGFDLVFTPAKSVSVLWALADDDVREQISQAHAQAWQQTLAWIEQEAALTRTGRGGLKQINTMGLTAAAFDHLDSRAGDPNLHTHVAVSSKVMGVDGKWRSLDARVLFRLTVAASERYNALVEEQLVQRLGVQFVATPRLGKKVPVREIDGVGADLVSLFSQRRAAITESYETMAAEYRATHGHEPPRTEQYRLAQAATLATRTAKEPSRPLNERVLDWRARAVEMLGSSERLQQRLASALHRQPTEPTLLLNEHQLTQEVAMLVLQLLGQRRATWTQFHVLAEATRVVRTLPAVQHSSWSVTDAAHTVMAACMKASIQLTPSDPTPTPTRLSRTNGTSIYEQHGTTKYTSREVLDAEAALLFAAQTIGGPTVRASTFEAAAADVQIDSRRRMDTYQLDLARRFACSGQQLVAGIGPAGAGKTTAMRAFVAAVHGEGGTVVALGPSAVAAHVLGDDLLVPAETLHTFIASHDHGNRVPEHLHVDERTVLLVDEAGMAGTLDLRKVLQIAQREGASVRLLGDPSQLGAVGAGGALRLIANTVGAAELRDVHRFSTPGEDAAGLLVRDGRTAGLDFYVDHGRVHSGTRDAALEDLHAAWVEDLGDRRSSIMVAATNDDVTYLNERARQHRIANGEIADDGVALADGIAAGIGDVIVTRHNDRLLRHGSTDYVKNGDLWTVTGTRDDGALTVQHREHHTRTVLPAAYVREHVQLGYATTVHRCQGMTVDVARVLVDDSMAREQLYTGITRGRESNHLYVVTEELLDVSLHHQPQPDAAARDVLEAVLGRGDSDDAALTMAVVEREASASLATLVPAYEDAYASALEPGAVARMGEAIRRAYPSDQARRILADDAWPHLAGLLYRHQRTGTDVSVLLDEHLERLAGARSPAALLAWQLDEPVTDGEGLPSWITPPPPDESRPPGASDAVENLVGTTGTQDAAVAAWLRDRAQRIRNRLDELTRRAAEHPPVWAAALPEPPGIDSPDRLVWDHHVRQIVAYRDRYSVDADSPLGKPVPADSPMGRARASAESALTALGAVNDAPDVAERDQLREIERQQALEQTELSLDELQQGALDPLEPMHQHLSIFGDGSGPGLA